MYIGNHWLKYIYLIIYRNNWSQKKYFVSAVVFLLGECWKQKSEFFDSLFLAKVHHIFKC